MVMWNLVGHGVKWAARGLDAFSRTDAGKKTSEVSAKAFHAAKDASKSAIAAYKSSRSQGSGSHVSGRHWAEGQTVVLPDGQVGSVVRNVCANEIGGDISDSSETPIVLVDLLQYTSELDRYRLIHEASLRGI